MYVEVGADTSDSAGERHNVSMTVHAVINAITVGGPVS